eukprot:701821-Pelagomonas_calceolata.AAC.2
MLARGSEQLPDSLFVAQWRCTGKPEDLCDILSSRWMGAAQQCLLNMSCLHSLNSRAPGTASGCAHWLLAAVHRLPTRWRGSGLSGHMQLHWIG